MGEIGAVNYVSSGGIGVELSHLRFSLHSRIDLLFAVMRSAGRVSARLMTKR